MCGKYREGGGTSPLKVNMLGGHVYDTLGGVLKRNRCGAEGELAWLRKVGTAGAAGVNARTRLVPSPYRVMDSNLRAFFEVVRGCFGEGRSRSSPPAGGRAGGGLGAGI